jgi:FtsP/CotA-like multicopper oxidase with cupredoxin domain
MPGGPAVPIWGFAIDLAPLAAGCGGAVADLPGPVLDVALADSVTVTLDNQLTEPVSISFTGQGLAPDLVGAPAGGSATYTFTADAPGTFLYQAGLNVTRQVPMGLYGALIIRPPTGAYGAGTEFDIEAVMVLSEVDTDLNNSTPGFTMLDYKPDYWLINGRSYPDAALNPIASAAAGQKVLFRYVNAGLEHHTMLLLGAHQRFVGRDGYLIAFPYELVAETIPAGSTADAIVTIGAPAAGGKLWLYNRQLHLDNDGAAPGGMMASLAVLP